jgi:hypothetical protein
VERLEIIGEDRIAGIIAGKIATLRANAESILSQIEGIDGQTQGDFGQRFLNQAGETLVKLTDEKNDLEQVCAAHTSALLFDAGAGREAALELVAKSRVLYNTR